MIDQTADVEPVVLEKNKAEQYRLFVDDYGGHSCVNLRVFWRGDDGEWRPSRKGLCVRTERWPELRQALGELDKRMRAAGLLGAP